MAKNLTVAITFDDHQSIETLVGMLRQDFAVTTYAREEAALAVKRLHDALSEDVDGNFAKVFKRIDESAESEIRLVVEVNK